MEVDAGSIGMAHRQAEVKSGKSACAIYTRRIRKMKNRLNITAYNALKDQFTHKNQRYKKIPWNIPSAQNKVLAPKIGVLG